MILHYHSSGLLGLVSFQALVLRFLLLLFLLGDGLVLTLFQRLFALLGGGAAFYYFKFLKPKQNVKGDTDLEDFEFEDYDEDEPEADTGETPEDEETEEETL